MPNTNLPMLRPALVTVALSALVVTGCSSSSSGDDSSPASSRADQSETFRNITPKVNHALQRTVPLMRGVASATYQDGNLIVGFKPDATELDQTNVENIVTASKNAATASPSPKKKK